MEDKYVRIVPSVVRFIVQSLMKLGFVFFLTYFLFISYVVIAVAVIFMTVLIFWEFIEWYLIIEYSDVGLIFRYPYMKKEKKIEWKQIGRIECYSEGFTRLGANGPVFYLYGRGTKQAVGLKSIGEKIKFVGLPKEDLRKFEEFIKSKNIETRFVYYSIRSEAEILPEDVGY